MVDKKEKSPDVAIILSKAKPPVGKLKETEADEESAEDDEMEAGLDVAVEELLAALEAKDADAVKSALKSFVEQCDY